MFIIPKVLFTLVELREIEEFVKPKDRKLMIGIKIAFFSGQVILFAFLLYAIWLWGNGYDR